MGVSTALDGLLDVSAYDQEARQHQDELREKFEIEFRDACLVIACLVAAASVFGLAYWMGR